MNKYFGTDGVRGRVGEAPMTVDFALRLASAAARVLAPGGGRVLIGKDTRVSGYMFESALRRDSSPRAWTSCSSGRCRRPASPT